MKERAVLFAGLLSALVLSSCTTGEKTTTVAPPASETRESLESRGHRLYATGALDSATAVLQRLLDLDPANTTALRDLAGLHYDLAMMEKSEKSPSRAEHLRTSRRYFAELERVGGTEADVYDRLCEISLSLGDDKTFLTYARKSAERYPHDRQYHNLGLAYFNVGDYQSVIKTEKEAIQKFKTSSYAGSFYRQLGRAYMKIDRDQTAERTFEEGLKIIDQGLQDRRSEEERRRMTDDRIAILLSLKRLHQTYHHDDKLKQVDRQLIDAGYTGQQ